MRIFLKKTLVLFFIFCLVFSPAFAKETLKMYGNINQEFSTQNIPQEVVIGVAEDNTLPDGSVIPKDSKVTCEIMQVQRERRWHKSGYILCKLKSYTVEDEEEPVDLSDKNIYLAVRKHEPIDSKEAAILTTEIIITQAAGIVGSCFIFFAPVDIAYFFTKGAILREKHHNWFKAGVHDAYDNSIFWFWLKGKPIELENSQAVKIQSLSEKKAYKLNSQIAKRNEKLARKEAKKQAKLELKEEKLQAKYAKQKEKNPEKFEKKMQKIQHKKEVREEREAREIACQQALFARRAEKRQKRIERKELKKQLKQQKLENKKARKNKNTDNVTPIDEVMQIEVDVVPVEDNISPAEDNVIPTEATTKRVDIDVENAI